MVRFSEANDASVNALAVYLRNQGSQVLAPLALFFRAALGRQSAQTYCASARSVFGQLSLDFHCF
jgi:hypothetical protein